MSKLVVSALGNRIYLADLKNESAINKKEDVTDEAIGVVFEHLSNLLDAETDEIEIRFKSKEGCVLKMMKE